MTPEQIAGASEHSQQVALFCWCNLNLKAYPQLKWMHSSGNGIFTTSGHKAKEKAAGLKKGVWDIFLPVPRFRGYDSYPWLGLWIEMKVGKNTLTDKQMEFKADLEDNYWFEVCYNWIEARDKIVNYLNEG